MESRVKLFGHPIHPMLIVFPLGLLAIGFILDIVYLITQNATWAIVAYYDIILGIILGLVAAVFGFLDWTAIPAGTRAKRIGLLHGGGNVVVVVLFLISWFVRRGTPARVPSTTAFILALLGILLAVVTGWLGGELVDRLGVGVDRGANLNAPNSLSGRPADSTRAAGD
jgi:uncharacterized membrane protein